MLEMARSERVELNEDGVVFWTGPVAMKAGCSSRDGERIIETGLLYLRMFVNEETALLCAFSDQERRDLFNILLKVKGIGVKTALLVLDLGERSDILRASISEDRAFFREIPGIGKARLALVFSSLQKLPSPPPTEISVTDWVRARESLGEGPGFDVDLEASGLSLMEFLNNNRT